MATPTVLVVDDDPNVRRSCVVALRAIGCRAIEAVDPTEARFVLAMQSVDVVLSDYDLESGENGLAVLDHARAVCPDARRVLMSGIDPPGLDDALLSGLVHAFLPKPFDVAELRSALGR